MLRSHTVRWILLLMVAVLCLGACSSSDDEADESDSGDLDEADDSSDVEDVGDSDDSDDSAGLPDFALSCDAAAEPSALIRGANGWVGQVVDAESNELIGGDAAAVLAAIEALRPIQDLEGILGTMREGLDNLEADVTAIVEGRYDDKVGGYGIARMNAVIVEEICGS